MKVFEAIFCSRGKISNSMIKFFSFHLSITTRIIYKKGLVKNLMARTIEILVVQEQPGSYTGV